MHVVRWFVDWVCCYLSWGLNDRKILTHSNHSRIVYSPFSNMFLCWKKWDCRLLSVIVRQQEKGWFPLSLKVFAVIRKIFEHLLLKETLRGFFSLSCLTRIINHEHLREWLKVYVVLSLFFFCPFLFFHLRLLLDFDFNVPIKVNVRPDSIKYVNAFFRLIYFYLTTTLYGRKGLLLNKWGGGAEDSNMRRQGQKLFKSNS